MFATRAVFQAPTFWLKAVAPLSIDAAAGSISIPLGRLGSGRAPVLAGPRARGPSQGAPRGGPGGTQAGRAWPGIGTCAMRRQPQDHAEWRLGGMAAATHAPNQAAVAVMVGSIISVLVLGDVLTRPDVECSVNRADLLDRQRADVRVERHRLPQVLRIKIPARSAPLLISLPSTRAAGEGGARCTIPERQALKSTRPKAIDPEACVGACHRIVGLECVTGVAKDSILRIQMRHQT